MRRRCRTDVARDRERHEQEGPQERGPDEAHREAPRRRKEAKGRSQSPDVERTTCCVPSRTRAAANAARSASASAAKRARSLALRVSTRQLTSRLGIDQRQVADVRQRLLARVADLDRDDVVAAREVEHRPAPVRACRGSPRPRARAPTGGRSGRCGSTPRRATWGPRDPAPPRDGAPGGGRACPPGPDAVARRSGRSPPNVTTPRRFPCLPARCPAARQTPSATSIFRRSAVPNSIDGDVSSTIHVVSDRSATCSRTCVSPVRAVTFQSI
jgi:hypothetical protein